MTDNTKPRLALDLDEIERQLKLAQQAPAPKNDPLAELARIVGQDDPFQSILAGSKPRSPARQPAPEPQDYNELYASEAQRAAAQQAYDAHQGYAQPQSYAQPQAYAAHQPYAHADDFGRMVNEAAAYDGYGQDYAQADLEPAPPKRSRRGLMAVGAALGVAVIGVGGVLAYKNGLTGSKSGDIPVVKAETGPLKVQPENPGGVEIPNQNKQILQKSAPEGQTKVVNREEQPVDVRQAARIIASTEGQTAQPTGGAQSGPTAGLGEPRRVRTVSIRPDGSQIGEPAASKPAPAPVASAPVAIAPAAAPPRAAQPVAVPSTASMASLSAPEPRTTSTTPQPRPAQAPQASPMPPEESARPAPKAQPARVASLATANDATPAPAPSGGAFAVQLAVRNSDQDARSAFKQLQQKYTGDLGGYQPLIVKAESNGRTIYRVRVGSLSKEDASALCSRIQGAGGQCFVSKNN